MYLHRKNKNFFNTWWWTVDRLTLAAILIIIAFSTIMVATASPAIAERIGLESFYFIRRQLVYLSLAVCVIFFISCLSPVNIRRFSMIGFVVCIIMLITVLFVGNEVKGARRWLYIFGLSVQPSEFIKPFFAVISGWILSQKFSKENFPAYKISALVYFIVISLIILQPDFGMVVTISSIWMGQLFLSGISFILIIGFIVFAMSGIILAYIFLPHVTNRINSFLDPSSSDNYQIKKSLEAFVNGGFYGKGPGEGTVKQLLPDSHTDFIFAVVGEELGIIACLCIVILFASIIFRGFLRVLNEENLFVSFAVSGLLIQFGIQTIINMGVSLRLLPTKGATLPFISYGGCSMLAIAIGVGMILGMTKRRYGMIKSIKKNYNQSLY